MGIDDLSGGAEGQGYGKRGCPRYPFKVPYGVPARVRPHPHAISLLRESLHRDVWTHCSREAVETVRVQETWATCLAPLGCIKDQPAPRAIQCRALGEPGVLDLHPPHVTCRTDIRRG